MAYIGQGIKQGTFKVLDTSGNTYNGSNTTFSLGTQVGSAAQLLVSHDGVIQKPGTDYTLASGGASITFSTAPASGASIFITEISGAVGGTVTPSDTSVTADKLNTALLTGHTDIGAAIADADLFLVDDGAGGTLRKTAASRIKTYAGFSVSDITGATELAETPADTDEFIISDAGTLKRVDYSYIKGGGMNLVATANVTSAAANVSFDNCFSSTYRNYLMVADMVVATNGATIEWRYRNGGSDEGGNYYNQYFTRYKTDTDDRYKHRTSSVNSFRTGTGLKNATDEVSFAFSMYFHNPNNGSTHSKLYMNAIFKDNDGYSGNLNGIGAFHAQSAHDGIKFFPSSGNFTNARVRIYGLIDS